MDCPEELENPWPPILCSFVNSRPLEGLPVAVEAANSHSNDLFEGWFRDLCGTPVGPSRRVSKGVEGVRHKMVVPLS